jgi:hypothetical protein
MWPVQGRAALINIALASGLLAPIPRDDRCQQPGVVDWRVRLSGARHHHNYVIIT